MEEKVATGEIEIGTLRVLKNNNKNNSLGLQGVAQRLDRPDSTLIFNHA